MIGTIWLSLIVAGVVFLLWFVYYWKFCLKRSQRTLHHTQGAKITVIAPVKFLNLLGLVWTRVTGLLPFYFKPSFFLNDTHYEKELQVIEQVGPRNLISKNDIKVTQRKGLELMCDALNAPDSCWTTMGRISFFWSHRREFSSRRELIDYALKNPEIMKQKIDDDNGLLFITGLPRTGSTFLQTLLALDPNARTPRTWEMWYPVPPAEGVDNSNHFHVKSMKKDIKSVDMVCPKYMDTLRRVHFFDAEAPEEDTLFMYHAPWRWNFALFVMRSPLADWWFNESKSSIFACKYLRLCFQAMISKFRTHHIVSKNPGHAYYLENLMAEFPKANVIFTHRDPKKVVPSWSKICLHSWHFFFHNDFEHPDKHELLTVKGHTKSILEQLTLLADRLVKSRKYFAENEPEREKQFFDMKFQSLIKDPIGTVKEIYAYFGYEFTEEFERKIKEYLDNQPRDEYGRVSYSLDELATTKEEIEELFQPYIDTYSQFF